MQIHTQYFYVLTQLVLDFGLWFLIFFLQHVSQEFTPKIFDTVFEIISVLPTSTSSLLLFKSKGNVSPWPLETLSPTFPPAPVVVLVRRSNFHNPNPSRPHGKSMELVTLSSNFFVPMPFAAETFFIVLDCLSHTYANPHSVFLRTDPAGPWFWPLILDLFPAARIAGIHSKNIWHSFCNRKRVSNYHTI